VSRDVSERADNQAKISEKDVFSGSSRVVEIVIDVGNGSYWKL
jgi:hypothetical protein